jgi:apolipoprotein N-acyltransferase
MAKALTAGNIPVRTVRGRGSRRSSRGRRTPRSCRPTTTATAPPLPVCDAGFALLAHAGYPAEVIPAQADTDAGTAPPSGARCEPPLSLRWALAVGLVGGLALAAAFPPAGIWPLAAAGPALLAIALTGRSLRASFVVGLVFGVAFFFPLLSWTLNVAWYAWAALAGASAVILAVLAVAQRVLLRLPAWPVAVAGWWVALEAFRDRWPWGGFPWGRLAMSQATAPTRGWAAIGGAPWLTFIVALFGATLAWVVLTVWPGRPWRQGRPARPERRRVALAGLALAATAGLAVLPAALPLDPVPANGKTAVVAAIQGNVPRARASLADQLSDYATVTQNHVDATDKLAQEVSDGELQKPDLVVWPENSTDIDPTVSPPVYDQISNAANAIGTPILVGANLSNPLRNAGVLWLPGTGPEKHYYVKRQLVPFGEYIPFRSIISKITSLTQLQPTDYTPGRSNYVFTVGQIRLGDAICYEIGFDGLVRSDVTDGANLLAMQTNDATFERDGLTGETGQQLAMARIRAVEHDRAVIVASTTGYSAIIAPDGQLITSSGTWQQAELEARVPLITYTTLADRVGPWPEYVIVALTVAAFAFGAIQQYTGRRRTTPIN